MAGAGGVPEALVGALRAVLDDASLDGAFVAAAISLPSASELIDDILGVDPIVLHDVRRAQPGVKRDLSASFRAHFPQVLGDLHCLQRVAASSVFLEIIKRPWCVRMQAVCGAATGRAAAPRAGGGRQAHRLRARRGLLPRRRLGASWSHSMALTVPGMQYWVCRLAY